MQIASQVMLRKRSAVPARFSRPVLAVLLGCLFLGSMPAHASRAVDEVTKLLDQGNAKQAAAQADSYLKQNPGDVEMRFMRGVIASEQKQSAQAIKIFSALVREYPSMPEPYNNLAVLYAAEGQERKAAEALEQAIRTNPSYTTAHENLGDLYARMASEAYSKALQLDASRQTIPAKLALITQLVPTSQNSAKTVVAQANTTPAAVAPAKPPVAPKPEVKPEVKAEAKPAPVVETKPMPKVEPKVEPKVIAKPPAPPAAPVAVAAAPAAPAVVPPVAVAAAPAAKPAEPSTPAKPAVVAEPKAAPAAKSEPKPAAEPKASVAKEAAEVESAVKAWVTAWEKQDMQGYLDAYSEKFAPANGASLAKWKEDRRVRIVGKNGISISLQNIQVSVKGDEATAKFRQNYVAGSLNTTTRKTLSMRHERGGWRIVRESTGG